MENEPRWIAWAAGLFEGEGSVVCSWHGQARCQLASTDFDVVHRFVQVVNTGQLYGPYTKKGKPQLQWVVFGGASVRRLFDLFRPYLGERRTAQFEDVLLRCKAGGLKGDPSPSCGRYPAAVADARGYYAHHRRQEQPCAECRACRNLYAAEQRAGRRRAGT